jgi:hypothetical protein
MTDGAFLQAFQAEKNFGRAPSKTAGFDLLGHLRKACELPVDKFG